MAPRKANRKGPRKPNPPPISAEDAAAINRRRQAQAEAVAGNQWWKARGRHGRLPTYPPGEEGAQLLMDNIEDYFQWAEDNPEKEDKLFAYEGQVTHEDASKRRLTTITGLCLFLGVVESTWRRWRAERNDLQAVLEWAEQALKDHNTRGAAAGLLNPMIVARIHGLAERTEVTGKDGAPLQTQNITTTMTAAEAAEAYARTRENKE